MKTTDHIRPPRTTQPIAVSDADVTAFDAVRGRLFGIAYRILGSTAEADDVVQDTWIRWQRADRREVRDPAAFLATTTTRLAINVNQSARARHETSLEAPRPECAAPGADPALEVEQRDALELAVGTLLARLSPAERAAYVLREAFDYPYRQIADVLSLSEVNARQVVGRARLRLARTDARPAGGVMRQRLVDAVTAAAHDGALTALEQLLVADVAVSVSGGVGTVPAPSVNGGPRVRLAA